MNNFSQFLYVPGNWLSLQEIYHRLSKYRSRNEKLLNIKLIGKSVGKRDILSVRLSDSTVSDIDKQVIVFVAVEHGHERNGAGVLLKLIDWLINDCEGLNILKQQIIYIVPVVNVDEYEGDGNLRNRNGVNLFCDYNFDGLPPSQPESRAVWGLLEEVKPDALVSLHGTSVDDVASGYHRVWESTSIAYSSRYERCYSRKVIDRINSSAAKSGFPQDLGEEDSERILPRLPGYGYHSFPTFELNATVGSYCYNRFHTLAMVMEIGPVQSGFLRLRELLRIGSERWEYECYKGYPNRIITSPGINTFLVKAGGKTSADRRENRVELWRHSRNILTGLSPYHHATCRIGLISRLEKDDLYKHQWRTIADLLEAWENEKTLSWCKKQRIDKAEVFLWNDCGRMNEFLREHPDGKNFPKVSYDASLDTANQQMETSLCFRLDKEVKVRMVMLNDRVLSDNQYRQWKDERYAYLEADLNGNWQRAVLAVRTTALEECKLFA